MTVAVQTAFDVVPLSRHIGAEIRGLDLRDRLYAGTIDRIHRAWLDHSVLLFRDQTLEQEDLLRVTEYFGSLGALARPASWSTRSNCRESSWAAHPATPTAPGGGATPPAAPGAISTSANRRSRPTRCTRRPATSAGARSL